MSADRKLGAASVLSMGKMFGMFNLDIWFTTVITAVIIVLLYSRASHQHQSRR